MGKKASKSAASDENIPRDRSYTTGHLWLKLDSDPVVMGVTAPLLDQLGPLVSVEIPPANEEMMLDVPFGEVEFLTGAFQLYPPADATIVESNEVLLWDVDRVANDPYGEGWLVKVRVCNPDQLRGLLGPHAYGAHCEKEWAENRTNE